MLNSSKRHKNTYELLIKISKELEEHDIEIIDIGKYQIEVCTGCENCLRNGECHIKDDVLMLQQKMIDADGIVIGTPIHLRQISGLLKVFLDRGCAWYHRSPLVGKPVLFATTTQVTGTKQAIKYLKDVALQFGMIPCGNISRTLFTIEEKINTKSLYKFEKFLSKSNIHKYRPTLKQVIEFNTQKVLAMEVLPLDRKYWQDKGYFDMPYFYESRISVVKRISGYLYLRMLLFFIRKSKEKH